MNYREFAKKYLEHVGAFDKDGNYGGMLGESVMALVNVHSEQGHSGTSAEMVNEIFYDLNNAYSGSHKYSEKRSAIWDEFWKSPEGMKIQESAGTPNIMNPLKAK